jgi:protein-tyrosine phosphatase
MALSHRPRGADLSMMRKLGCTHVVTLLKESEGAQNIGKMTQNSGMTWIWIPVPNGNHPEGEVHQRLQEALPRMSQLLDEGASLFIHCAAGIHRTGTVAYGLLRWRGVNQDEALKLIAQMRIITHDGMGKKRLRWGGEIARTLPEQKTGWFLSFREFVMKFWVMTFKKL